MPEARAPEDPTGGGPGWARLRAASVLIRDGESLGSGYLVARQRIGTAWHVVKHWRDGQPREVVVGSGKSRQVCHARLLAVDEAADAAVLGLVEPLEIEPLPVARRLEVEAAWQGYGFPAFDKEGQLHREGLPIDGHVQDPCAPVGDGGVGVLLYSAKIAAGSASPLHGFSGGPVVVDGALIGHLLRHIGDPDDRRRAALGYVYACPIDAVVQLIEPALRPVADEIAPTPLATLRTVIPAVGEADYHVFVSYHTGDREWAVSLVDRLVGAGLRVFLAERELAAGDDLAGSLQAAMQRSRAAVTLVSRGWIASRWCQQEASLLVKRAVEDPSFRLIPLRLDDAPMPGLLDARVWVDFRGTPRAVGARLDDLLEALLDRPARPGAALAAQADAATRQMTDEFVQRIQDAEVGHSSRVEDLVGQWRRYSLSDVAPLIAAAELLNGKGEFERALKVLQWPEDNVGILQLRASALSKLERDDEAIEHLLTLRRRGYDDAETLGLLAGCYKRLGWRTRNPAWLRRAFEVYAQAYERWKDSYNGINAASMALQCGDAATAMHCATEVVEALQGKPLGGLDRWQRATLGEGHLLRRRFDDARDWYARAAAVAAGRPQDLAVMRRQARMDLTALGKDRATVDDVLPVPRVLAYFGHRVDAPDRDVPRFPAERTGAVRRAIHERLRGQGQLHGFGSAADGADLLFVSELASLGQTATIVLPYPDADFVRTSVAGDWKRDFETVLKKVGRAEPLCAERPADDALPAALTETNLEIMRRALAFARTLEETAVVCAVWDGKSGDGPGGTSEAVELWRRAGYPVDVVDPMNC